MPARHQAWCWRLFAAVALLGSAASAQAEPIGLVDAWRAAQQHDLDFAAARAARDAAATHRDQAQALGRPSVALSATAGLGGGETSVSGARFSAPGFGATSGVHFDTSVTRGATGRLALVAALPLYNRERQAQSRQLGATADLADLEWLDAQQTLMLTATQRYLDVMLAQESLRVSRRQASAVEQALVESRDRFELGDVPVTDTHEAAARAEALRAQLLALDSELQLKRAAFADATGLQAVQTTTLVPGDLPQPAVEPLDTWLADAAANSPRLRMQRVATDIAQHEAAKLDGAWAPTVDLVAQVSRERLSGRGDFGSASNATGQRMLGLQLSVPLYTGGMREARQREAWHTVEKAQAQADRARQQVAQQVRAAWLGVTTGAARLQALALALQASQARLEATRLGRQVGDRTTLDLLNAENDAASAELALLVAGTDLLMNRLRLAAAAGRLDEAALRTASEMLRTSRSR